MATRSMQLQIRVTPGEKSLLKRLARDAGQDLSAYVLTRALPPGRERFGQLIRLLGEGKDRRFVLAEVNDFLSRQTPTRLGDATEGADVRGLSPHDANYVAAMVEHTANRLGIDPPAWTRRVPPLDEPWFATSMSALRGHLLRTAPVAFRRRNLFVDASVGDRV